VARRHLNGARAIVTGASSGIGRELALELGRRGAELLVTARREDRLQELIAELEQIDCRATLLAGDITDESHRARLLSTARERWNALDLLVNNAGSGGYGPFAEAEPERLRRIMELNFFAPAELTRAALPLLRQGRSPMIVNIGSVLGHRAVPDKSEYSASKFALHGWSDALRAELAAEGIDVLLVSPSTTDTEFFNSVETGDPSATKSRKTPAATVARKTVRAIERGRHEIVISAGGKAHVWLDRLAPWLADRLLSKNRPNQG
jgi:short-subunit dehydrogenase